MWNLRAKLMNSSLHFHQNLKFLGIRAQVLDLWSGGTKVTCGVVNSDTWVSFRSSTALVTINIQMSSEMWEFDTCGDLYMEKAVNGFLTELFQKWTEKNICHEVTIVLFSRTYYEVNSLNEIPEAARSRMHVDYAGQVYEDFYRVVAQNVRSDDWRPFLTTVKKVVQRYEKDIQQHINKVPGMPKGITSKASQGNVLEAINMSMNVFDNHYINRNFDRTGQLVIVITPGAGVFEADRTLTDLTKQRIIDYGIGSDIVCLAEQPPHAVPLIMFHDAIGKDVSYTVKYSIVHWLNYSFYFSPSQRRMLASSKTSFIPRMRVPERQVPDGGEDPPSLPRLKTPHPVIQYQQQTGSKDVDEDEIYREYDRKIFQIPQDTNKKLESLINNPFSPSTLKVKLTADRRRWTHAFPRGPMGEVVQTHHQISGSLYVTSDSESGEGNLDSSSSGSSPQNLSLDSLQENESSLLTPFVSESKRRVGCAWGITGEQAWSPFLQTGVDWKSLTATACFPVTTDFFPDNTSLQSEYFESPYTMDIPREENSSSERNILQEIINELIFQRLIQDFQLVIIPERELNSLGQRGSSNLPLVTDESKNEFVMSCGTTFHKLTLNEELRNITVVRYISRHTEPGLKARMSYHYNLLAVGMSGYDLAHTRVHHKPLEDDWNYRDNYICRECLQSREEDFEFIEKLKFWSSRYLLLPSCASTVKKLQEEEFAGRLDVFQPRDDATKKQLLSGFFKFAETLNKKRAQVKHQKIANETPVASRKISRPSGAAMPMNTQPSQSPSLSTIQTVLSNVSFSPKDESQGNPSSHQTTTLEKLTKVSPPYSIAMAMANENSGLAMITSDQKNFPAHTFISYDAVQWIQENIDTNLTFIEAMSILQILLQEKHIQPVFKSKESTSEFLYGYYWYHITPIDITTGKVKSTPSAMGEVLDQMFEAACVPPVKSTTKKEEKHPMYKHMEFEVGSSSYNKRFWKCQLGFHEIYDPDEAFEVELQWVTSTPLALNEMVLNWARRVFPFGLHLVPASIDPFGSLEDIRDPLKQPLYIPVTIPSWINDPEEIIRIQKAILFRFGFIPNRTIGCVPVTCRHSSYLRESDLSTQYIHVTGHAFVTLGNRGQSSNSKLVTQSKCVCKRTHSPATDIDMPASASHIPAGVSHVPTSASHLPASDNDTLMFSEAEKSNSNGANQVGFHWIRNFLLNKRWKLQAAGDERLYDSLFADFVRFCANEDCRLEDSLHDIMTESMEEEEEAEDEEMTTISEMEGENEDEEAEDQV
ncbi:GATOR1 complex protein DEPDC5-like isoform X3 [Apostichopus japonicus]